MRLGSTLFAMLCLYICLCNGAPPAEEGHSSKHRFRYTEEEDKFIVEELLRILKDHLPAGLHSKTVWETIAENHRQKRMEGTQGFSHERSAVGLLSRLRDFLIYNRPDIKVKVPETWTQASNVPNLNIRGKGIRVPYNEKEDNFIIEALSRRTNKGILSAATSEKIRAEHDIHRLVKKTPGFENERTAESIRKRIGTMKRNDLLPNKVITKNTPKRQRGKASSGARSSKFTHGSQQPNSQETNEEQDDPHLIADMIQELLDNSDVSSKNFNVKEHSE